MRIGIFTEAYPPIINGVSTSIINLQRALEKKGHEVFIVTVNNDRLKYDYEYEDRILRLPSFPIHSYDYRLTSIYPIKAVNIIKKMNLDVIHTNVEATIGMFARFVSKQLDIPLVHTYHTMWKDYTHYVTKGKKILDVPAKEAVKYLSILFGDKTATERIVPSRKIYNLFKDKYKVDKNIHIVPTGLDVENFYKEKFKYSELKNYKKTLGIEKKDIVIITVSRLAKEKSVDFLIRNHKEIVKKYPNAKLLIVGDGPSKEELMDLVLELNLEDNVVFAGKVPLDEVKYYYQLANVFTTASRTETQGLTVIEAMASSLPIVAVNDDSFIDSVIDDLNGSLFDTDAEYVNAMMNILGDSVLRERLSNESRVLSDSKSSSYFADRVLHVYEIAIKDYNDKHKNIINKIKRTIERKKSIKCQK